MLTDRLKTRLNKNRPMTPVTVRIPSDVLDAMKAIAPQRGFAGYQALLKSYLSDGLRRDEAQLTAMTHGRLVDALRRHGVSGEVIEQAEREAQAA